MLSIQLALTEAAAKLSGISASPLLDAEVLLSTVLNKDRSHLRAWPEKVLAPESLEQYANLIQQRQQGMPVAYLTGQREFWSRDFYVTPDVLIPRPDTELLIEISLELIAKQPIETIIDLGTGSGIIAITLAAECPHSQVIGVDYSLAALAIAKHNKQSHQCHNVQFLHSNWFADVPDGRFDLIVSNPPYIAEHDPHLQQGDLRFEPQTALVSPQAGLHDIQLIAEQARQRLADNGHLLIEHGYDQQAPVQSLFQQLGYTRIITYPDLSGHPRVTHGQWHRV